MTLHENITKIVAFAADHPGYEEFPAHWLFHHRYALVAFPLQALALVVMETLAWKWSTTVHHLWRRVQVGQRKEGNPARLHRAPRQVHNRWWPHDRCRRGAAKEEWASFADCPKFKSRGCPTGQSPREGERGYRQR